MRRLIPAVIALFCLALAGQAQQLQRLSSPDAIAGIQPGTRLVLFIRASADAGPVWGSDVYSGDSDISAASVHAGVLANGQTGTVVIDVVPGASSYISTKRNGVTSQASGAYPIAFKFSTAGAFTPPAPPAPPASGRIYFFSDPSALQQLMPFKQGSTFYFSVEGSREGNIYGTGTYSINSNLAATAVHAGIIAPGQKATVEVTILPGQSSYIASSRNGVTSQKFGPSAFSFSVEDYKVKGFTTELFINPGSIATFPGAELGKSYAFWVTGKADAGMIWGTDFYTSDSSLASAVVHKGLLANGESGIVIAKVLPGRDKYEGVARNGVASSSYGPWPLSYSLEKAE